MRVIKLEDGISVERGGIGRCGAAEATLWRRFNGSSQSFADCRYPCPVLSDRHIHTVCRWAHQLLDTGSLRGRPRRLYQQVSCISQAIQAIATHYFVSCGLSSVCRLSHRYTLLKPFHGFWSHYILSVKWHMGSNHAAKTRTCKFSPVLCYNLANTNEDLGRLASAISPVDKFASIFVEMS